MAENKEPIIGSFISPQGLKNSVNKYASAIAIASVITGVIVILLLVFSYINNLRTVVSGACSTGNGEVLTKLASTKFSVVDNYQLAAITVKIMGLPKYQKDPNCLFVVTTNYANSYQATSAEKSLKQFNRVYNGHNVSRYLTDAQSVKLLRSRVANLSVNSKKLNIEAIP